jgi:hypothetical protein
MRVEITKSFQLGGDQPRQVTVGEVVEGFAATEALNLGCGREVRATPMPAAPVLVVSSAPAPAAAPAAEPEWSPPEPESKPSRKGR